MKVNKYYYLAAVTIIGVALLATWQMRTNAQFGSKTVQLSLKAEKAGFALGEIIGLNFEIKNMTDETIEINQPSVHAGNMRLFVSSDGANYTEYVGPNWGNAKTPRQKIKLPTGESSQIKATLLYNDRIPTAHLTELYAEKIRKERLNTEFAIPNPGRYWLKAVFKDAKTTLESEPLAIDVSEPIGLDAIVWKKIKTDGAYAYFLQTGSIKYYPDSVEAREFKESLQQISAEFPNSNFAERINEPLTKYNESLENLQRLKSERQN